MAHSPFNFLCTTPRDVRLLQPATNFDKPHSSKLKRRQETGSHFHQKDRRVHEAISGKAGMPASRGVLVAFGQVPPASENVPGSRVW